MPPSASGKRAIVVGASSGIGRACVKELSARGFRVAAVARRASDLEALVAETKGSASAHAHDVTHYDGVPALFSSIVQDLGGLDLIIYAAGAMPKIDSETYDFAKDKVIIEVNVLGCIAWLNQAAMQFRKQESGSIVGISSISGDRGRIGNPVYCTSKAAMNTYLEALRNRLSRHGVSVTTIKPGFVDTAMTKGMTKLFWLASPQAAAVQICDAAENRRHTRYVFRRWGLIGFIVRSIPSFIFRRMDI